MPEHERIEPPGRAHLRDADGYTPPIYWFASSPSYADVVRRYWLPVWSMPDGTTTAQRVLQYPVCLIVVAHDYATFVGPSTGLSIRHLSGSGWALGAMLQPAAGAVLLGAPVTSVVDVTLPLQDVPGLAGAALVERVRTAVHGQPGDPARQQTAVAAVEEALQGLLPVDEEGLLVNKIVEYVESESDVVRVGQVCERFDLSERSLQRLAAKRIGLSPKWLIQRRRLHEAAELLASAKPLALAGVAAGLGYADQSHFTRDFRTVTGLTPGAYAAEPRDT